MEQRDPALVARIAARPYGGYARHGVVVRASGLERVVACVALLLTMVVSGVLLGSPTRSLTRR